ncbi:MAG: DEAD/DEAH box helicase, partial [Nitrospira sp.]|nr:DEAD/DEAH box helicase [Nitrospira sp.]
GQLRREIEPVTAAEFMRFVLRWQHVQPEARLHGEGGLLEIIRQLAGFEAPASVWESQLLRVRLARYEPEWLDRLCLNGTIGWGRLSGHRRLFDRSMSDLKETDEEQQSRGIRPTSATPIGFFPRGEGDWLWSAMQEKTEETGGVRESELSPVARHIQDVLHRQGACFFTDLVCATRALASEVEEGLWELVAAGLVTADGFDNLRAFLDPHRRRGGRRAKLHRPRHAIGRWSLLRPLTSGKPPSADFAGGLPHRLKDIELVAHQLLRRYGVVFRDLLVRDSLALPWRDLLVHYRRMEMTGAVRGGRFVAGFVGEQFALPEAVESLRAQRHNNRNKGSGEQTITISACDPLNLVGIILPGPRVPAVATNFVVLRDGAVDRVITGGAEKGRRCSPQPVAMRKP